jgi:light-regulated signal transduction histidine kinase (bacteriophytochrome)
MNAVRSTVGASDLEATIQMLQSELETTNREVMLLTLELEQRVAERTAQLASSNRQLLKEVAERIRAEAEVKKLNLDLQTRAQLLEAANEDLEAFSSSVSHDLRNPLSRILGFASLLESDRQNLSEEKQTKFFSDICHAARDMTAIIDNLLRLSRSSQVPLAYTTVDLDALVHAVIAELTEAGSGAANVQWEVDSLPLVQADSGLLRQAFTNLLSNALKYSRREAQPHVHIQHAYSNAECIISIHDNGVGFDSAKASKLFSAFQRLHASEEFEGIGIGLVNVKRIVCRHRGRVWAESSPGQGASFFVALPKLRDTFANS